MHDNIAKMIEESERLRAEKIAKFLELLHDPDLAPYVSRLTTQVIAPAPKPVRATPMIHARRVAIAKPVGFRTGNNIQQVIRDLALPHRFTAEDVYVALKEARFQFTSTDHRGSVGDALFKLCRGENPVFRIAIPRSNGGQNVYERVIEGSPD
jgi:hypothetical protein